MLQRYYPAFFLRRLSRHLYVTCVLSKINHSECTRVLLYESASFSYAATHGHTHFSVDTKDYALKNCNTPDEMEMTSTVVSLRYLIHECDSL